MTTDEHEAQAMVIAPDSPAALAAEVILKGDLRMLSEEQKARYIAEVCASLGLNPLTRPFELIILNGKEVLYPTRGCTDQLRATRGISVTRLEKEVLPDLDLYQVTAYGRDATGREDSSVGAVSVKGLAGEALANAIMKCETKAKRRMTLSISGLGWADESEIGSIPAEAPPEEDPRKPLTVRIQERVAALEAAEQTAAMFPEPEPEPEPEPDGEPIVLDDSELRLPAGLLGADEDAIVHEAFVLACRRSRIGKDEIARQASRTWPGVPSSAYKAAHWRALAQDMGLTL